MGSYYFHNGKSLFLRFGRTSTWNSNLVLHCSLFDAEVKLGSASEDRGGQPLRQRTRHVFPVIAYSESMAICSAGRLIETSGWLELCVTFSPCVCVTYIDLFSLCLLMRWCDNAHFVLSGKHFLWVFCVFCCPNLDFSHGKVGSLSSPRKASCDRAALPSLFNP